MDHQILSEQEIRSALIQAVAEVRCVDRRLLDEEIVASGGDLMMDSQEGVTAIAKLEGQLRRTLPGQEDLEPEQFTSLSALVALVLRKVQPRSPDVETR